MKRIKSLAAAAMLTGAALMPAHATEQKTNPIMGIDAASLAKFGGAQGVRNWVESLFYYIMLDNRINWIFKEFGNVERQIVLNTQLEQMVLGGAVEYQGASMAAAHADLGITMAQLAIAWVLANDNVAGAIVGASRPEQVESNAAASGITLDADVLATIDEVLGSIPTTDPSKTASPPTRVV